MVGSPDRAMYLLKRRFKSKLAPVLKTIFHKCAISYACSQSNSGGSVLNFRYL